MKRVHKKGIVSMFQASRRRNPTKFGEWIETDESSIGGRHVSRRSILPTTASRRKRFRLRILMIACLLVIVRFSSLRQKSFVQLCRLVTWYLDTRHSEDIALWRGTHLEENFPKLDTTAKIDLVVSHCDLPIDWIFEWASPLKFRNISIFSKCGKPVVGAPENAMIVRLENVGRCDHTYAHFMANYHSATKERGSNNNSDFVVFLKDNDNSHRNHYSRHKKLTEMIPLTKEFGFACHEETNWVWSETSLLHPICQISYYHDWSDLGKFQVEEYSRLRRDDNLQFQSQTGETLGDYAKIMGIQPHNNLSRSISTTGIDVDRDIHQSSIVPVCYGGNFMVQSEQILSHDPDYWERIESSLSRSNNIAEGHFMERLWGPILAKPLGQDLVDRVLRQARYGVCRVEKNHLGALSK